MPDIYDKINHGRHGSSIRRFHSAPTLNADAATNGLHTNNMLQLLFLVIRKEHITVGLTQCIVWHDSLYEPITSDINGAVKADYPEIKTIVTKIENDIDKQFNLMPKGPDLRIVKALDKLESFLFSTEQRALGNKTIQSEAIRVRTKAETIERLAEIRELGFYDYALASPAKFVEQLENSILEHVK